MATVTKVTRCGPLMFTERDDALVCGNQRIDVKAQSVAVEMGAVLLAPADDTQRADIDRTLTWPLGVARGMRWENAKIARDGSGAAVLGVNNELYLLRRGVAQQRVSKGVTYFDVALSGDGNVAAAVHHGRLAVIDAKTGAVRAHHTFDGSGGTIALTRDGETVAFTAGDALVVLDVKTNKELRRVTIPSVSYPSREMEMSPDDTQLALISYGAVRIFELATLRERTFPGRFLGPQRGVAFSADGTLVATSGKDGVRVFQVRDCQWRLKTEAF